MNKVQRVISFLLLALALSQASAQIIWKHTTSDIWVNPVTQEEDTVVCITALSCYGSDCIAAGKSYNHVDNPRLVIYRSTNNGTTWTEQGMAVVYDLVVTNSGFRKVQYIDSMNVVAMALSNGVIVKSSDGGSTWFNIDCPARLELLDIHFSDPLTGILVCASNDSNIFVTTNGGESWNYEPRISGYAAHSYGNGKFRVFKYGHGPFYTTYDSFASIDTSPPIFDTVSDPGYQYVFPWIEFGAEDTIYAMGNQLIPDSLVGLRRRGLLIRSTDCGKNWEQPWVFPSTDYVRYLSSIDRDTIFAGCGDQRHYAYSIDRGKTWQVDSIIIDTAHETGRCFGMQISRDGHPIAAFGSPGLAHESILTRGEYLPSKVENGELVKYYTHFYPNPTTGVFTIQSLFKPLVTVVDIFGRQVASEELTSVDGKLSIDLTGVTSGIYNVVFDIFGRRFIAGKVVVID